MNSTLSRRNMLAAAPFMGLAAAMAGAKTDAAAKIIVAADQSAIMFHYAEHWRLSDMADALLRIDNESPEGEALAAASERHADAMRAIPARTAQELAAKFITETAKGAACFDWDTHPLWAEARALVA